MSRLEKLLAALALLPFGFGISAGSDGAPPVEDEVVFSFADPEILESSGLLAQDGLFATVNDSGDAGRVFTVDPADGATVAVTTWDAEPEDVEAMAALPDGDVLVADIGDNNRARDSVELLRVPFGQDGAVDPSTYELVYPDGSHDAETLLVHPGTGQVMVVAKEIIGRLYTAPEQLDEDGPNQLSPVGEVLPIATDGAFFPDGDHFILRDYGSATVYRWPSLEEVGEFELPDQRQGEGIAVDADGAVYLSSEGPNQEVLRVALPAAVQDELAGAAERPTDDRAAEPGEDGQQVDGAADDGSAADEDVSWWPWALGGVIGVGILVMLVRLRPS